MVIGAFTWAQRPQERDLGALLHGLRTGEVTSVVVGVVGPVEVGEATARTEWEDGHGAWYGTYRVSTVH